MSTTTAPTATLTKSLTTDAQAWWEINGNFTLTRERALETIGAVLSQRTGMSVLSQPVMIEPTPATNPTKTKKTWKQCTQRPEYVVVAFVGTENRPEILTNTKALARFLKGLDSSTPVRAYAVKISDTAWDALRGLDGEGQRAQLLTMYGTRDDHTTSTLIFTNEGTVSVPVPTTRELFDAVTTWDEVEYALREGVRRAKFNLRSRGEGVPNDDAICLELLRHLNDLIRPTRRFFCLPPKLGDTCYLIARGGMEDPLSFDHIIVSSLEAACEYAVIPENEDLEYTARIDRQTVTYETPLWDGACVDGEGGTEPLFCADLFWYDM